jgi:hypothetical protein
LRVFLKSSAPAWAGPTGKELARPFGGAPDTATVLRVFLKEVDFGGLRVVL